jgi:hypothetical protein
MKVLKVVLTPNKDIKNKYKICIKRKTIKKLEINKVII